MLTKRSRRGLAAALSVVAAAVTAASLVPGCSSSESPPPGADGSPTTRPVNASIFQPKTHKSGSQLWSENCTRCHNIRPPQYYSDAQWDMIAHHMRLRANLTGEEQRKITEFLSASN
jgi:cytochrome c5